jgi:hypothetical protein
MLDAIDADVQKALERLEVMASDLPNEKRHALLAAVVDLLDALITSPIATERRPNPPSQPVARQIRIVVNRLRDKVKR